MVKKLKNYILTGTGILFLWVLLLIIAYALPMHSIHQHISESIPTFEKEGLYPQENINDMSTQRDNFTDAYMINIAGYDGKATLLEKAFGSYYTTSNGTENPIEWLKHENGKTESYARYWHGYVVFLKALLLLFNYEQIRKLLYFFDMLLIIWIVLQLQKNQKNQYIFPFLIALLFFPLTVMGKSIQFSTVFIPTLLSIGIVLKYYEKLKDKWDYFFFIEGSIIAYLDLLTYPIVNLGFLLCFVFIFEKNTDIYKQLKSFISKSFFWAIGYGITWMFKWIIATIVLHENIISNALNQASFRTSNENAGAIWTYLDVLKNNIGICSNLVSAISVFFILIVLILKYRESKQLHGINQLVSFTLVALLPFAWYKVLSNHSYIHYFFTHRNLSVTVLAVLFGFLQLYEYEKGTKQKIN